MPDEELAARPGRPSSSCLRCAARATSPRRASTRAQVLEPRARRRSATRRGRRSSASASCASAPTASSTPRRRRAIVRELKAVGGDLRALRLALTGRERGPELCGGPRRAAPRGGAAADRCGSTDTAHALEARRAAAAARADRGCTSAARPSTSGPTSATRARSSSRMWLRRWLRERGYDVDARPEHHGHQRQDLRGGARAQRRARRAGDRVVPGGHRAPRARACRTHEPKATETVPADRRADRGAGRARARLRGRRRRLLPRRALPRVRHAVGPAARPGRGAGAEPAQGGPARLRALEGEQAGRGHLVGLAVGPRPARAGTSSARRWPRSSSGRRSRSTAAGSTSSSRTTRTSSRSRGRSGTRSRGSGCTTGCSRFAGEKMSKSLGNVVSLREALDTWGRETLLSSS